MFAISHCNPFCHVNKTLVKKMIGYRSFHSPEDCAYNTRKGFHPFILRGVEEVFHDSQTRCKQAGEQRWNRRGAIEYLAD